MILWNGGLPRSGKTYDAVTRHILGALRKGRPVDAYVDGLDHARIADAAGVTVDRCRELLVSLTEADLARIWEVTRNNALVVLDEAQDFWPNRARMGPEMTKFVTQHGHRGQDLLLMGQDFRDVHVLFRRRIAMRFEFLKLDALGKDHRYSVTTYRHRGGDDEPTLVGTQQCVYDPKLFGLYASHTGSDVQTENYKDGRASVWAQPVIKYGVPASVVLAIVGGWYMWRFFSGEALRPSSASAASAASAASGPFGGPSPPRAVVNGPALAASVSAPAAPAPVLTVQEELLRSLDGLGRIRFVGAVWRGTQWEGLVEWIAGDARVMHRMSLRDLRELGIGLAVSQSAVEISSGAYRKLAVSWPVESSSRVSAERQEVIRRESTGEAASPAPGGGVISLGGSRKPAPAAASPELPGDATVRPPVRRPAQGSPV